MKDRLDLLADRVHIGLDELAIVLDRIQTGWERARQSGDDYYIDGVALNLHSFYSGLERIFEQIAETLDGMMPQGENWHMLLLQQMSQEIPAVRPAVISESVCRRLNEFRGFRHVVRHVYAIQFDPLKLERLVTDIPRLFSDVRLNCWHLRSF